MMNYWTNWLISWIGRIKIKLLGMNFSDILIKRASGGIWLMKHCCMAWGLRGWRMLKGLVWRMLRIRILILIHVCLWTLDNISVLFWHWMRRIKPKFMITNNSIWFKNCSIQAIIVNLKLFLNLEHKIITHKTINRIKVLQILSRIVA